MANTSQNVIRSSHRTLWIILGTCLLCVGGLFTFEAFPRYIVLPLTLPLDDYKVSQWNFPTHATWRNYTERYFVWRAEATLAYEDIPDDITRKSILYHFDYQFLKSGWTRSEDIYASCSDILPEAKFLKYMEDSSENGYVWYHKRGFKPLSYSTASESVCLAIWSTSPGVFNIVILTAKPSPLTIFLDEIDL